MLQLNTFTLIQYLTRLLIIFLVLPLHEFAHAWTAHKLGDDTAEYQGRMTLNPIAHIDPIGAILLLLTGYGWAKPVPINPSRFDRKHSLRFGVAITALAGPVSNLIAALLCMIGIQIFKIVEGMQSFSMNQILTSYYLSIFSEGGTKLGVPQLVFFLLYFFVTINVGLAVFNLIPIPPLDGSKVLGYFTSAKFDRWLMENAQIVRIIFLVIVFTGILSVPLNWASEGITWLFEKITNWIPKVFG